MRPGSFWKSNAWYRSAIFVLGFLLSWLPLVLAPPSIAVPDELFQGLEQGHRLAFGYGLVPWEFDYGARSWALPVLAALPMRLTGLLGLGPDVYVPLTWGLFSLGAAAMILCAGFWGAHFFGRWGGVAVALVTASWIDNMAYGGRVQSEVVAAHLLIVAVFLAEPGYRTENRNRLLVAGFAAALASLLRMQLGPIALLLWLFHWRDRRRILLLSLGAGAALVADGVFDLLTGWYPFQPIWQNIHFNLVLDGAAIFSTSPWWWYLDRFLVYWGALTLPFLALAILGARRLPIMAAMALLAFIIHAVIPHKEYRFILPAVMMASILCGIGLVEAAQWLAATLRTVLPRAAGLMTTALAAMLWLGISTSNMEAMGRQEWRGKPQDLEMSLRISRMPSACGVTFTNTNGYGHGGYTFLHRRIPLYFDNNDESQMMALAEANAAFNMLVVTRESREFFSAIPPLAQYALDHCASRYCLLVRPGGCTPLPESARPALPSLRRNITYDGGYPYAVGIAP